MDSRKPTVVDARGARGVQVGDHNTQHNAFHLAPRETAWPVRAGAVPPLVHCRQQRPADLDLDAALAADAGAVPAFVLSGLGGVGKTQLAAAAAHRRWDRGQVDLLIWVSATSATASRRPTQPRPRTSPGSSPTIPPPGRPGSWDGSPGRTAGPG